LLLPLPLSADQKKFHDSLLAQGVASSLISRLMQHPNAGYLQKQAENPWLRMSLQQVADARITPNRCCCAPTNKRNTFEINVYFASSSRYRFFAAEIECKAFIRLLK
jgi:hypothetical protein